MAKYDAPLFASFAVAALTLCPAVRAQSPAETTPPEHKRSDPQQSTAQQAPPQHEPTAAEISAKESVASALLRNFRYEEYQIRTAAEAMPAEKYSWRPVPGNFGGGTPGYGPSEMRTFGEQIKHVACANFAFAAELDGQTPPPHCDTGGPSPAKTRDELVAYLHDSFKALNKSLGAISKENMFQPIQGPYGGPNTRLGLATVGLWHVADHYGQLVLYMRLNGIVPPASRPNPPELKD